MKQTFAILLVALVATATQAQSPAPVVIQAVVPGQTATSASAQTAPAQSADSTAAVIKVLQQMKTANEDILAKQGAMMQQLEDLEKAADQLRIYNKRG